MPYSRWLPVTSFAVAVRATTSVLSSQRVAPVARPTYTSTTPVGCASSTSSSPSPAPGRHQPTSRAAGRTTRPSASRIQARASYRRTGRPSCAKTTCCPYSKSEIVG